MTAPITVLGAGHAAVTLARELRKLDAETPLRIITADDGAYYYKPDLSKALAAGKDADGLIKQSPDQLREQLNAEVLTQTPVTRIAPDEHAVYAGDTRYDYSRLVLALGAEAIRPPFPGDAAARVHTANHRSDYAKFRAALQPGARVLIVGAGLIGCEFANDLAAAGYAVTVADIAGWPLPRLLPEVQGRALQAGLEQIGVQWKLENGVQSLNLSGDAIRAEFGDGSGAEFDTVLSAVGLRPHTALARDAGLECALGIVVDAHLQTSAPDIYAIGDCAQIGGRLLPYILPIAHAARALAPTLTGTATPAKLPAMPVIVKTPACPTLVSAPADVPGAWEVSGEAPDLEALYKDENGNPIGFALTGKATAKRAQYAAQMPPVFDPAA
ncbi:MAG: FAD-dependent oxidoreductase [Nevskiales bacterium]|nr:FAD-dependent oxidoreductase [Nevskiales bacterium]